jgi:hypothetical protein
MLCMLSRSFQSKLALPLCLSLLILALGVCHSTSACKTNAPSACNDYDSLYTKHKLAWRIKLDSMARAAFQHLIKHQAGSDQLMAEL